jgi:DNA-dependent metalloprotease WSS1
MAPIHQIDYYKVGRIVILDHMNDGAAATSLLQRIASQVEPIMKSRKFIVPLLSEFYPKQRSLLGMNVNRGAEILLRLRPPTTPTTFLPYETILATMLHELTHNIHGPHDGSFYKLLNELKAECEQLMLRGITGSGMGFDGPSSGRIGGYSMIARGHSTPAERRDAAARAAEERARKATLMPRGPQRLGGDLGVKAVLSPSEAAAAAAAQRVRDNTWCPTEWLTHQQDAGTSVNEALQAVLNGRYAGEGQDERMGGNDASASETGKTMAGASSKRERGEDGKDVSKPQRRDDGNQSVLRRAKEERHAWVDDGLMDESAAKRAKDNARSGDLGFKGKGGQSLVDLTGDDDDNDDDEAMAPQEGVTVATKKVFTDRRGDDIEEEETWSCAICTFINKSLVLQCEMCHAVRPPT